MNDFPIIFPSNSVGVSRDWFANDCLHHHVLLENRSICTRPKTRRGSRDLGQGVEQFGVSCARDWRFGAAGTSTTRSCCSGPSGHEMQGIPLQRPLSDAHILVLCI